MLKEYLVFTANFLKEKPWNCCIDIEYELAKTFDNLQEFKPPNGEILVAIFNDKLIGTTSLKMIRNNASELKRMFVEPYFQGKKIGQLLLNKAIEKSIEFGACEMYLESPPPCKKAHKLYKKNGFKIIKEYPEVSIPSQLKIDWIYMKNSNFKSEYKKLV